MNAFMQIMDMADISADGAQAPKDAVSGAPQKEGNGDFAGILGGISIAKGGLSDNKNLKDIEDNILRSMIQFDPELLPGLQINEGNAAVVSDGIMLEVTPEGAEDNAEALLKLQVNAEIAGKQATVILGNDSENNDPGSLKVMSNAGTGKSEILIDSKAALAETGAVSNPVSEFAVNIDNTIGNVTPDITNNVETNKSVNAGIKDNNISAADNKTIDFAVNRAGMEVKNNEIDPLQYEAASKIFEQVEDDLNIRQVRIFHDAAKVETINIDTGTANFNIKDSKKTDTDKVQTGVPLKNNVTDESVGGTERVKTVAGPESNSDTPKVKIADDNGKLNIKANVADKPVDLQPAKGVNTDLSTSTSAETAKIETMSPARETTPVKFVVPENLSAKKVQSRQTVFIKLEPENLGTVRLTLSSSGQNVMGRLVVDTPVAQHAVESNINQLLEDLADKGVRLDSFQVMVGGGQTGQRHAHGSNRAGGNRRYGWMNELDGYENENNVITGVSARNQYISSSGINWLA